MNGPVCTCENPVEGMMGRCLNCGLLNSSYADDAIIEQELAELEEYRDD